MKIEKITVRYGELRSTGYPSFNNKRVEVELCAALQPGEVPRQQKDRLLGHAMEAVKEAFGDKPESPMTEMEVPF